MMRSTFGAAIALFLLAQAAPADAIEPQPGQWKMTVKAQITGRPPREVARSQCLTAEMIKDPEATFTRSNDANSQRDCKRTFKKTASGFTWTFECTGKTTMNGSGTLTFDSPVHYTGSFKIFGSAGDRPFEAVSEMEGERVGDCEK